MDAAAAIARLADLNPDAAELGRRLSLAARIDRALVRRARLLPPRLHASAESDLWFSELVEAQTPLGFSLDPDVAGQLRDELARSPVKLAAAWGLIADTHREQPTSIRIEELVNRLSLSDAPEDAERVEQLLNAAAGQMVAAGRDNKGWARWLTKAIARLPAALRTSDHGRTLQLGSGARLHGGLGSSGESDSDPAQRDWLAWLLSDAVDTATIGLRLRRRRLDLGELGTDAEHQVEIPATDPRVVDLSWFDGEQAHQQRINLGAGERRSVAISCDQVEVASLTGARWRLSEANSDEAPGGIDFSALRAAHRPFLAREELVEQLLAELAEQGGQLRTFARPPQIFVTKAAKDRDTSNRLDEILQGFFGERFLVWDDSGLEPGKDMSSARAAAIDGSFCVIVLLSRASLASRWVEHELRLARKSDKPIIVVRLQQEVAVPEELTHLHAISLFERGSIDFSEVAVGQLTDAIERAWRASYRNGALVQITGDHGRGKTALLSRLLDRMEDLGRPCLHYFADGGPETWRSPPALLASLSAQLRRQMPALKLGDDATDVAQFGEALLAAVSQQGEGFDLTVFVDAPGRIPGIVDMVDAIGPAESGLPPGLNLVVTSLSDDSLGSVDEQRARYVAVELDQQQESNDELLRTVLDRHSALLEDLLPPGRLSVKLLLEPGGELNLVEALSERLQRRGFAVFEASEDDWASPSSFLRGNGVVVVIVNGALLERTGGRLGGVLEGVSEWIAISVLPEQQPKPKEAYGGYPELDVGDQPPVVSLNIAGAPDPAGAVIDAIQQRTDATPAFSSAQAFLLERCKGNIGRLKGILDWVQGQPDGRIDSGRIPPVLYRDMEEVWAEVADLPDTALLNDLALTLAAARQPFSLQLLVDSRPDHASVDSSSVVNLRAGPSISADKRAELAAGTPLRVLHRTSDWLLAEAREVGRAMVAGWVSGHQVQSDFSNLARSYETVSGMHGLLSRLVEMGLVIQSAAPIDGLDPDGLQQVLYAFSHSAIGGFVGETFANYELSERHQQLAALIPPEAWLPGPVQDLAWRYAVANAMRHRIAAGDAVAAEEIAFNGDYLSARIGLDGVDALDQDLARLQEGMSDAAVFEE